MARTPPPSRLVTFAATIALVLGACSTGAPTDPDPDPGPDPDTDRVAAVVEARRAVAEPAQALGTAAREVTARVEQVADQPGEAEVAALRDAVASLQQARAAADDLELDPTTDDVRAAVDALDEGTDGAEDLAAAAEEVAVATEQAIELDEHLGELVAAWDEPGSRSQLLARFEEAAATADDLATDAGAPSACPGPVDDRRSWAEFVAATMRELADLVAARDGLAFDERRGELAEAPYGVDPSGVVRGPGRSIDDDACPALDEVEGATGVVAEALDQLEHALNPADLQGFRFLGRDRG